MSMAYGMHITHREVHTEGISRIEPLDIELAREFGYRIKLLAISRNHGEHVEARVHPTMVPQDHLLAAINGAYNAIHFHGDCAGNILLYGLGAGKVPTGSAVAADVVDIARDIACNSVSRVPPLSYLPDQFSPRRITAMDELYGPYYFRFSVLDQPGVLARIAGILSEEAISIESVIQKGRKPKEVRISEFLPWEELEDGDIMFKVKRKAKIVKDDGSVQEFRVDLIKPDRKIFTEEEKAALNIGNGTIGIPLVTVVPYNMPTQGVGLTLRLEKMQLLEIKEYSRDSDNEFDDESGEYEVPVVATGAPAGDSEFQDEEAGQGYTV